MRQFEQNLAFARRLDEDDPLAKYRDDFHFPSGKSHPQCLYFTGNSLGLQPKSARRFIEQELDDWAQLGVEGHFKAQHPWMPYHEFVTEMLARLVGAKPIEVVAMNSLTVNLHLMMASFYRPTKKRYKILIEANAFPSDQYAVKSQLHFHGFDPEQGLIEIGPKQGETFVRTEDVEKLLDKSGDEIALVLLGGVNYFTGQAFEMERITKAGHQAGCVVGFDLAHAAGNLVLQLHDWNADFACWCSYKYLNSGPGGIAGCFVHERHANNPGLPRFSGWWGHDKVERFKMGPEFTAIPGAEGWQLSNPPIFQLAALRASLEIFDEIGMKRLYQKSEKLTAFLEFLLEQKLPDKITILTPRDSKQRGAQLSVRIKNEGREIFKKLTEQDVICDWREPDVIRVAPVPLYNSFEDVFEFVEILKSLV